MAANLLWVRLIAHQCSLIMVIHYPGWAVGIQLWVSDSFPTLSAHILEEASQKHR